jgi:tetratricopeptide (TPR) repeat protein
MPDYFDLGDHQRAITTSSVDAQLWFNRGLVWTYGFNHEEALRCFERARAADPQCAMAHWGLAYAAGPHYNKPWIYYDPVDLARTVARTYAATQQALALVDNASPVERALIEALPARYPAPTPAADCMAWNAPYAGAMRAVYRGFGDDLDVAALFAEALLNQTPWQLWDLPSGEPKAHASTTEARAVLERALETPAARRNPGVLHMYIHLMEMSPWPEQALRAADDLRGLVPDAGHLLHMCTHIDVLCGHYHDVVACNSSAIAADRKYVAQHGTLNAYTFYRVHNLLFKMYGAMFLGQSDVALAAADDLVDAIPIDVLQSVTPSMADSLEGHISMKLHALARFGRWQQIIDMPLPDNRELYVVTTAMLHYAKGLAYAASGHVAEAQEQRELFEAARERVPETRRLKNNMCRDVLAVGAAMLAGELAYRIGDFETAFDRLRQAVALEDGLAYSEPWAWMQPTRHALGALLLEQGRVADAEAVYRADLGLDDSLPRACQHPDNIWSLHGYHECLTRLGKQHDVRLIGQRLTLAQARADAPITASCFCRLSCCA